MVSDEAIKSYFDKAKEDKKSIIVEIEGGVLVDVLNLPEGFTYTLVDHDDLKEMDQDEYDERFNKL